MKLVHSLLAVLIASLLSGSFWSVIFRNAEQINTIDLLHALSGAVGSALSISLLYPLETIRTRLQVDTTLTPRSSFVLIYNIFKREGLSGLYKGWMSLVVALMALNFVYFYCFHTFRRLVTGYLDLDWVVSWMRSKVVIDLISGYLAGCVAVLCTGPLWLGECFMLNISDLRLRIVC